MQEKILEYNSNENVIDYYVIGNVCKHCKVLSFVVLILLVFFFKCFI
jgi:hypothetical protein